MAVTCKSCGAPILWIESPKHKWIPCDKQLLDYKADRQGPDSIVTPRGEIIRCHLTFSGAPDGAGRRAHWATCPNADAHRRRRKA